MKRDVIILGIHDGHNSGAALVRNGKVVAGIHEERLVNVKNYSGPPLKSVRKVFQIANIHPADLDLIAMVGLIRSHAPLKERPMHVKLYERAAFLFKGHRASRWLVKRMHKRRKMEELKNLFKELEINNKELLFVEHHLAHASCAYYQKPWNDETLILTLDGAGDGLCSTVSIGEGSDIRRIAATTAYNSPGNIFYSEITGYLGLKRWEHEYKVMGMAPYGRAEYCMDEIKKIVRINPNRPLEFQNTIGAYCTYVQNKLRKLLAEKRFDNISAATQKHFEDLMVEWVGNAISHSDIHKIVCSGGMFLNVKANKLLREMEVVDSISFHPAAGDEGTPVGAALYGYHVFCKREGTKPEVLPLSDLYYGAEWSEESIREEINRSRYSENVQHHDEINREIGFLVARGKIIAVFSGRDEWGPRALGNRSILADPRDLRVIRKINFAIKLRDFWMPFAPSILDSRMEDYLIDAKFAPYMVEAFDTTSKARDIIAGLHPHDSTARPQIVNDWNPGYREILEEFEKITGVGGVLNTSFNLHGYPIVGSPRIALDTFAGSELDGLAIRNYLIMK